MIVEDIADNLARLLGLDRVGVAKLHQCDERLPNRPTLRTLPGRRIERNGCAKLLPAIWIEECPSNSEIAGRIADTRASEVDHCIEPALFHQKIGFSNVAMNPYRRPLPRRCQCRIPDLPHGGDVDLVREHVDGLAC